MNSTDHKQAEPTDVADPLKAWGLGIVGAILGCVAGWFIYGWLLGQGFYSLAIPGALIGFGFGYMSRRPMLAGGIFCAVVAAVFLLACECFQNSWAEDQRIGFFLAHLNDHDLPTKLMYMLGVACAFWFGRGR